MIFGDYEIAPVTGKALLLNRELLEKGFMKVRSIRGRLYPDFCSSAAFAVVDHEIAHVYVKNQDDISDVQRCLSDVDGVDEVLDREGMSGRNVANAAAGELLAIAQEGFWFAYPWWSHRKEAPDYATHIDIHRKPGFDPCEMFFSLCPPGVSQNTDRIRGSHGRYGRSVACGSDVALPGNPQSVAELGLSVGKWLMNEQGDIE